MTTEIRSCNCVAHGCPMTGVQSTSTTGSSDWLCWIHFGKDAGQWQAITVELNRMQWLAEAVVAIRRYRDRECWHTVYRNIKAEILLNQRSDLLNQKGEDAYPWAMRLERELRDICEGKAPIPLMQPVVDPGASDSWKKAQFAVPEHV